MSVRPPRPHLLVRAVLAAAVGFSAVLAGTTSAASASTSLGDLLCLPTPLTQSVRLSSALGEGLGAALRTVNGMSVEQVSHLAEDESSWVDACGRIYVADEAAPASRQGVSDTADVPVPADVFDLSSRPQSTRTIYLDFTGATYTGTRWKNGQTITSPAYSIDGDPTTFSAQERAQVFLAWRTVAEDYAPFDVDVTTREPSAEALTRSSANDQTYGMPVVITPTNSVGADCGCGGLSYVGVLGQVNGTAYQPAWAFTNGSGTAGYDVGQVVSHEVGHTFGLSHDGTSTASYYSGAKGWAPIMGASYGARASQWSKGDYPDANNTEDDVATIARTAPLLADDHGNTALTATKVAMGSTTAGTITTRSDVDAFTFTAGGPVSFSVAGPAGVSDLDVRLRVQNSLGAEVATLDPVADVASDQSLAAVWSADLPSAPATYTVLVDGAGNGDPAEVGRYDDYGSLGAYTASLTAGLTPATPTTTTTPTTPTPTTSTTPSATGTGPRSGMGAGMTSKTQLEFVTRRLPKAHAGRRYRTEIRFSGPVTEARVDWRLPAGLTWRAKGDRIVISGTVARRTTSTFATVISGDDGDVRMRFRLVVR